MPLRKFLYTVLLLLFISAGFGQGNINVYDTLVKEPSFTYLLADAKREYFLNDKGALKRLIHFTNEALHYHKGTEDSLYVFLKKIYGDRFSGMEYYAAENVKWNLGKDTVYVLKKNKKVEETKRKQLFTSNYELSRLFNRPAWLKDEEDAHCFHFNYYVHDSLKKTIYCFNSLTGPYEGIIKYDGNKNLISETAFYTNKKVLMQFAGGMFSVYASDGKKLFSHTEEVITAYSEPGDAEWKYNTRTKKIDAAEGKQVGWNPEIDYVTKLQSLWRKNFSKAE
jgi:outer membrane protein assembly factor BamB